MSPYNVLFICNGNSARSIIAEALLNHWGQGRFHAYSAGSRPKGFVHPLALEVLERANVPGPARGSKSWEEFAQPDAPHMDFVFTLCDEAAGETCPIWPGQPVTAHWSTADPAVVENPEDQRHAFAQAFHDIDMRVKILTSLRLESLDHLAVKEEVTRIGALSSSTAPATR
jgi:arsenate reductase